MGVLRFKIKESQKALLMLILIIFVASGIGLGLYNGLRLKSLQDATKTIPTRGVYPIDMRDRGQAHWNQLYLTVIYWTLGGVVLGIVIVCIVGFLMQNLSGRNELRPKNPKRRYDFSK